MLASGRVLLLLCAQGCFVPTSQAEHTCRVDTWAVMAKGTCTAREVAARVTVSTAAPDRAAAAAVRASSVLGCVKVVLWSLDSDSCHMAWTPVRGQDAGPGWVCSQLCTPRESPNLLSLRFLTG